MKKEEFGVNAEFQNHRNICLQFLQITEYCRNRYIGSATYEEIKTLEDQERYCEIRFRTGTGQYDSDLYLTILLFNDSVKHCAVRG